MTHFSSPPAAAPDLIQLICKANSSARPALGAVCPAEHPARSPSLHPSSQRGWFCCGITGGLQWGAVECLQVLVTSATIRDAPQWAGAVTSLCQRPSAWGSGAEGGHAVEGEIAAQIAATVAAGGFAGRSRSGKRSWLKGNSSAPGAGRTHLCTQGRERLPPPGLGQQGKAAFLWLPCVCSLDLCSSLRLSAHTRPEPEGLTQPWARQRALLLTARDGRALWRVFLPGLGFPSSPSTPCLCAPRPRRAGTPWAPKEGSLLFPSPGWRC